MSATLARLRHDGYGSTLVGVIIVTIFLFPVCWMVSTSFKAPAEIFATPPALFPLPPSTEAYREAVFGNPTVVRNLQQYRDIFFPTKVMNSLVTDTDPVDHHAEGDAYFSHHRHGQG